MGTAGMEYVDGNSSPTASTYTYIDTQNPADETFVVDTISSKIANGGATFKIGCGSLSGTMFTPRTYVTIDATGLSGILTWTAPDDFAAFKMFNGDLIFVLSASGTSCTVDRTTTPDPHGSGVSTLGDHMDDASFSITPSSVSSLEIHFTGDAYTADTIHTAIQDLRDEKELVLFHDYRNGAAVDESTNEHDMAENDGTLTDTTWDGYGLTFPLTTSVIDVADDDDLQLEAGCLVAYFNREILGQSSDEYIISKRDGGGVNYQWFITSTGCSFYDGANTRTVTADLEHYKTLAVNFEDGEIPQLFGDGDPIAEFSGTVAITKNDAPIEIGNYNDLNPLQSTLCAALIVNRRLTALEHFDLHAELLDRFDETHWKEAQLRILSQYQDSPNVKALIEVIFNRIDNVEYVLRYLKNYTGLDTACGVWLDIAGDHVGIERPHIEQSYGTIFAFKERVQPGHIWEIGTSSDDNNWRSVCYSDEVGLFVAVADTGTGDRIMTSPDGLAWTTRVNPDDNNWYGVCYGAGLFVAVAKSGTGDRIMTSPDGITWTARVNPDDNQWRDVCYSEEVGLFVAVADTGTGDRIMTSPDGITWTARVNPDDNGWFGVCYGAGLFVAVGYTGTLNRVMTSPDGITWTTRTTPVDNAWDAVTYGGGLFVAVANSGTLNRAMTSPDGITWTIRTTPVDNAWYDIKYGDGLFVALAFGIGVLNRVMTSTDGITWTSRTTPVDNEWFGLAYGGEMFVAVAASGTGDRVMTSAGSYGIDDPYKGWV